MSKHYLLVLATVLLFVIGHGTALAEDPTLHPFFAQNGDCYMLVGDGPYRGVYAMNNLTTGVVKKLYDPFDAYGIVAAQSYSGSTIQK